MRANTLTDKQFLFNQVKLIRPSNDEYLQLSQLEVWLGNNNIARDGTASASSTFDGTPSAIIDGLPHTSSGGYFMTNSDATAFVMIDLPQSYDVNEIQYIIINKTYNFDGVDWTTLALERITNCNIQFLLNYQYLIY